MPKQKEQMKDLAYLIFKRNQLIKELYGDGKVWSYQEISEIFSKPLTRQAIHKIVKE